MFVKSSSFYHTISMGMDGYMSVVAHIFVRWKDSWNMSHNPVFKPEQDLLNPFCIMFERTLSLHIKWLSWHYSTAQALVVWFKVFVNTSAVHDDKDQASQWPYKWPALGFITDLLAQITYNRLGLKQKGHLINFIPWTFLIFKLPHDTLNRRSTAYVIAVPG